MANIIYNIFKANLADGTYRWNTQPDVDTAGSRVKFALMKIAADDVDDTALDDVLSGKDYASGSYTRPTLASLAVVNDTTSNHAELNAADVDGLAITSDSANSVVGIVVFIDPSGSSGDGDCVPVCYMDVANFKGNGSDISFVWNAEGLMKLV
jgi:hypothetical protein